MARIRIVQEWLRSPVTTPVRARAIMVVADTWAEQKVLMRAYQSCRDQSRPSIVLQGAALPMGPASPDPHGPWGVHVDDHRDGRAQDLREQLELAAARMAGTDHPPRLADEEPSFDRKATNQWSAGAPRDRNSQIPIRNTPAEPLAAAAPAPRQAYFAAQPDARTIMPFQQDQWLGTPPPAAELSRPADAPVSTSDSLETIVGRTMPLGFRLDAPERAILNRLGKQGRLAARDISEIAEVPDAVAWMEALMSKLADHGLDIVEPGDDNDGEPTYVLRH